MTHCARVLSNITERQRIFPAEGFAESSLETILARRRFRFGQDHRCGGAEIHRCQARRRAATFSGPRSGRSVAWLARLFRVQEVVSSNLTAPTILLPGFSGIHSKVLASTGCSSKSEYHQTRSSRSGSLNHRLREVGPHLSGHGQRSHFSARLDRY